MPITAILGLVFLGLAIVTTYLMFQFWGYPYDVENRKSSCPQWKMNIHRAFGYAYVVVYVVMLTHMLPRLVSYQVEFPPRTVAHICLGLAIGVLLIVKISILRWFRHFEEWMPYLGVSLLLCTVLLSGLSLPSAISEQSRANELAFTAGTRDRLLTLLSADGLPVTGEEAGVLATEEMLHAGREVLLNKCTHCHDLRTVIARPRTPEDWFRTVSRMAAKPSIGQTIELDEQKRVATYLTAITPDIQESALLGARDRKEREQAKATLTERLENPEPVPGFDAQEAQRTFAATCSQCHPSTDVESVVLEDAADLNRLLTRMVGNGLTIEQDTLTQIREYLLRTYVNAERGE